MTIRIALDLGSSKIAILAYDVRHGRTVASATATVAAREDADPDLSLWNVEWFWRTSVELLRELSGQVNVKDCAGITVTGQQHGVVLLDGESGLRPCSSFISWMDGRGRRRGGNGCTLEEEVRSRLESVTSGELGCRMATGYGGLTLYDLNRRGLIPPGAVMVFLTDYINKRLCGMRKSVTDPTMAASSGLFDVRSMRWSEAGVGALGLRSSLFPEVVATGTRLGGLAREVSAATGFPAGLPVYQGWGDNQASIQGCLGVRPKEEQAFPVVINYGTGTQVTVLASEFRASNEYETRPFLDGRFLLVRSEPSGGRAWALLRDFFLQTGRELFQTELAPEEMYDRMKSLADEGSDPEMVCRPRFFPCRHGHGGEEETGSFSRIQAACFTPGEMIRSLLAGMANESYEHWQVLARVVCGETKDKSVMLLGSGNMFRKNPVFCKCVERRFGLPVHLSGVREEAAVGTALLPVQ
ncbi:MAG: FGGY family carbohydrate kinase [Planctomycetia bacterium]|nr:FGGY family carbohydrate kinase [Planctomycetia bacterium]